MKTDQPSALAGLLCALREGSIIAYPTEAVFGLGCDPDNEAAVKKLLDLKQRPWTKGLILIAADYQQLMPYIDDSTLTAAQKQRVFARWPGPVTWVMPARSQTSRWLTGQFSTLAVRVSAYEPVRRLCLAYGKPLVSTSANLTGQPPGRTPNEVRRQLGVNFPVMEEPVEGRQNPSEIRDALTGSLIRQG